MAEYFSPNIEKGRSTCPVLASMRCLNIKYDQFWRIPHHEITQSNKGDLFDDTSDMLNYHEDQDRQ